MLMLCRNIKADFIKLKRTPIVYIHMLIPIIGASLFLLYYSISSWDISTKLITYIRMLAIIFPLLIGIITGIIAEQEEEAGSFQNMFMVLKGKSISYFSKLLILLVLSVISIIIATFVFAFIFKNYRLVFYTKLAGALFIGNVFLYLLHLFISFRFGKGASIGLGIVGVLIAALMRTGLGDSIWEFIPWAWAIRLCDSIMLMELNKLGLNEIFPSVSKGILVIVISIFVGLIFSLSWFNRWEGRESND